MKQSPAFTAQQASSERDPTIHETLNTMQFRRSGQRAERRRRVLMDESLHATTPDSAAGDPSEPSASQGTCRHYSEAALTAHQPPVTCLVPKSVWQLSGVLLLGLLGIAGVQALYAYVFVRIPPALQTHLTALDVSARGSIANWYSTLLLALSAIVAVMVFSIRRHRLDDYRGYYRVWLPAALALLVASLDCATGLHNALGELADGRIAGLSAANDVWGIAGLWLLFGSLGLRMMVEVRSSPLTITSMFCTAAMFCIATAVQLGFWPQGSGHLSSLLKSTPLLLGHLGVAFTTLAYCRFVNLDAQQTTPPALSKEKPTKQKTKKTARKTPAASTTKARSKQRRVRVDEPHAENSTGPAKVKATAKPELTDNSKDNGADSKSLAEVAVAEGDEGPPLSRAERRRKRKQARRQQSD